MNGNIGSSAFTEAKIVASIPARWTLNPSYYHSFAITDNYIIFAECPVSLPVTKMLTTNITGKTVEQNFSFFPDEPVSYFMELLILMNKYLINLKY